MLGYWVIFAILFYRAAIVLPFLIGYRVFNIFMFTYIDYTLVTVGYALLIYSMRKPWTFTAAVFYILPIMIGTTLSVTFSIVIIIWRNGGDLLLGSTTINGGIHTLGEVHTAHFIIHFLTTVDLLVALLFNWNFIKANYRASYLAMNTLERVAHAFWFLLSALFILVIYMLNFDFVTNYPVHLAPWLSVLLQVVVSVGIASLFWLALIRGEHDIMCVNRTPMGDWVTAL